MPNSNGTVQGDLIARNALTTLLESFPIIKLISTDFSAETALFGQKVVTHLPTAMTASTYNDTDGYVPASVAQTDVELTIDQHPHVTFGFSDTERSGTDLQLIDRYSRCAAHAVGQAMVNAICAKVTNANYVNKTVEPHGTWDRLDVVELGKKLNVRKLPALDRFMVLNSDYFGELLKDSVLVANPGSPSDAVRSGQLGNVHGISVYEYPQLPTNSENLGGWAGVPEGMLIATRVPAPPKGTGTGTFGVVTEPNTGLTFQTRNWYDFRYGKEYLTITMMFGVGVGNAACIERIVSA